MIFGIIILKGNSTNKAMGIIVLYQHGVLYKKAENNKYTTDCDIFARFLFVA